MPVPAGPAQHETLASYLSRLAALHALPVRELWDQLSVPRTGCRQRVVLVDRLAVVVNRPVEYLARALPELRDPAPNWALLRHQPQPRCPRCDARHEGGPVLRLLPHHHYVCTKHRYWIGLPDVGQTATRLHERLAVLVHAQHKHRQLLAHHGAATVFDAVLTGFLICGHIWADRTRGDTQAVRQWTERTNLLIPPGTEARTFTASRVFAAVYPEAVKLAAIIASPVWRQLAGGDGIQQREFMTEACRRVGIRDSLDEIGHQAIRHWMCYDSHHPPSRPEKTFPDTKEHGAMRPFRPRRLSYERTERGAAWFTLNRRGGNVILYHRHLKAVMNREWAPVMDGITATVAASAATLELLPMAQPC